MKGKVCLSLPNSLDKGTIIMKDLLSSFLWITGWFLTAIGVYWLVVSFVAGGLARALGILVLGGTCLFLSKKK